ncbi:MAG TPA: S-methyl-5'-thioadenosine phosphorylase [Acidimicrobiales bacterium]|nr:S-methyl-5'-thioadenosine phosphorylase [Acidimicrobiales bacterium]
MEPRAGVGVIGGSGFYELLADAEELDLRTPYGPPSAPLTVGEIGGVAVAFLPRHGRRHQLAPHQIPYRANLWALAAAGVSRVLAPCAAGSLRPDVHPGQMVVLDQLVDRTWGRADTYFDQGSVNHITFADPYCPELRPLAAEAGRAGGFEVHDGGTIVVIQGPRFSTRAESAWFRSAGWDVIGMTQYPEAALARELGLCYAAMALITDYDTGVEGVADIEAVSMDEVFRVLQSMVDRTRAVIAGLLPSVPARRSCRCGSGTTAGPLSSE